MLQKKVDTTFEILFSHQEQMTRRLEDHAYHTSTSNADLMSASARFQAANSLLAALQSDRRLAQLSRASAPPERSIALIQYIQQIESDISVQTAAASDAQHSLRRAERRVLPVAFPSLPPRPVFTHTTSTETLSDGCKLM
jgi:hypothetical protein